MTQVDDLIEKMRRRPPEMLYREVCQIVEAFGWIQRPKKSGTSHVVYTKAGEKAILTISTRHGKMVPDYQLNKIRKILGLDD